MKNKQMIHDEIKRRNSKTTLTDKTTYRDFADMLVKFITEDYSYNLKVEMLLLPLVRSFGTVNLTIVRKGTGFGKLFPRYYLFDENKTTLLLNAKKKVMSSQGSHYIISTVKDTFDKEHYSYIGKLRKFNTANL